MSGISIKDLCATRLLGEAIFMGRRTPDSLNEQHIGAGNVAIVDGIPYDTENNKEGFAHIGTNHITVHNNDLVMGEADLEYYRIEIIDGTAEIDVIPSNISKIKETHPNSRWIGVGWFIAAIVLIFAVAALCTLAIGRIPAYM